MVKIHLGTTDKLLGLTNYADELFRSEYIRVYFW